MASADAVDLEENDMQDVCKKGKASFCNNCQYYKSKNDECQREIQRLLQTVSSLTRQIAEKNSEINKLHDKIESIHGNTFEQNESVKDVNVSFEIQMVVPKEEPNTSANDHVIGPWQQIGYIAEESSQTTVDTVQIKKEPQEDEEEEEDSLYEQCRFMVEQDEEDMPVDSTDNISEINTLRVKIESIQDKTLEQEESAMDTVRDMSSFLEFQVKEDLPESGDVVNGPMDSQSVEDTDATDETEEFRIGNRTCMWMVRKGKGQPKRCGKEFPTIESLVSHCNAKHLSKGFVCLWEGCKRYQLAFSSRNNLINHFRIHSGEKKPFRCPCEGCGRTFSELCTVRLHMNTHSKVTVPCTYPGCNKVFNHKKNMVVHYRVRHKGEGGFKCPFEGCGLVFNAASVFRRHFPRHKGPKPHVCTFPNCKMSFASKESRDGHFSEHREDGVHKCPLEGCGKRFKKAAHVKRHVERHQSKPEKRFRKTERVLSDLTKNKMLIQLESFRRIAPKKNESTLVIEESNCKDAHLIAPVDGVADKDSERTEGESEDRKADCQLPKALQNESVVENTVKDLSSFIEIQMKEDLPESSPSVDLLNGHSQSEEDTVTDTTDETEKGTSGNRTCMWMVPDGKGQPKRCGKEFPTIESLLSHCEAEHLSNGFVCLWEGCKRNERPFQCRSHLTVHFRIHLRENKGYAEGSRTA